MGLYSATVALLSGLLYLTCKMLQLRYFCGPCVGHDENLMLAFIQQLLVPWAGHEKHFINEGMNKMNEYFYFLFFTLMTKIDGRQKKPLQWSIQMATQLH